MKAINTLLIVLTMVFASVSMTGCLGKKDNSAEESVDATAETMEDIGDSVEETMDDAGDEMEDMGEDMAE